MKETRPMANIAKNIVPPQPDQSILEFYRGYYDCVYIILHPFIKVIHPGKLKFSEENWPTKEDYVKYSEKLLWNEFLNLSGLGDINRLDIALRNSIGGLVAKHVNKDDVNILGKTIEINNLFEPGEGNFSPLLIDDLLKALIDLGHQWIYIGDEHGFERRMEYIPDIIDNKVQVNFHHESWYTMMNEVLITTHWDSHFTFLCSDRKTINAILKKYPFEGFYCTPETQVYWSINSTALT